MNFGNFFRNLSQDKEASNASGSGLFAAPGRLLESVTAKTGSLVSDLSHKVDLAKKIDTLKKYSSMDKFGQSVLGTAFQTNQSNDPTNKPTEGETQLAQPLCQEQRQQNYRNKQSIDQIYSDQPPTQSGLQNRLLNEQRDYKGSLEQPSYTGELPTNQNQQPEQDIFKSPQNILHPQEEPTYGYQNKAHEQTDNQIRSPKQSSCVDYPRFQEDDGFLTQQPREKTWALEKEKPMEEPPFSGQEYRYKSTFETPPQPSLKTFGDLRKFGIEEDMERMSFDEQITDRHKNPFNCETSFDATNARKSTAPIMRQSTTPGARPPRPPPPRSRSGLSSGSIEESPSATPKEAATSPTPTSPCGSFQKTLSFGEETEEGVTKKSSTSEIGYLTRLQCQEIVSAVDNMIADAIEEAPQYHRYEPMKQADSYESSSRVEEMCGTSTPSDTVFDSHRTSEVKNEYFAGDSEVSSVSTYGASVTGSATQRADENKFKTMGSTDDSWGRQDTPGGYDDGDAKSAKHSVDFAKTAISAEDVSRKFIRDYVQGMIAGNDVALESKNEEFREKMLTPRGREYFSKAMELEGARTGGLLSENGLRMILSRVVFVLTECQKSEDFVPAKRLLTVSLVYHIEDPMKTGEKVFLFSYIKSQPIWHSLRFWNACFFQSVQETRAKLVDQGKSDAEIDNAIIGQIRSYLNTMQVFNLHATMREEFLRKQGDLFNLRQDAIEALSSEIENETID